MAALALIVLALVGLAGCEPKPPASSGELTLALAIFPGEARRYRAFLRDFERRNHVKVDLIAQSYDDILRALLAEGSAGRGSLDLAELDLSMLARAHRSVRPLDAIVPPESEALFPKAAWNAARFDGHLFFVPHRLMWQAMIYNRRHVPNPPATWDELLEFARRHPGKVVLKAARYEGATCDMLSFLWSAGGDPLEPESPAAMRAFGFLSQLGPYLNAESAVYREMPVLEAQARGSVWIHFNWPFALAYLASKGLAPSVDLSAPIPSGPDGTATVLGGGYLAIARSAPHPKLAAEFIRYLLKRDTQARLSRELGWYGSVGPPAGSEQAKLYAGFIAMRPYVRARPTIDCYAQLSNGWQRAFRAVLFAEASPAAALKQAATAVRLGKPARNGRPCACR
jgi:ABC-type glycerol-3-phosphate transport system substrate-binding protein